MEFAVRPALPTDHAHLIAIAAEGDSNDCDTEYLAFIAATGRLLCATVDERIVGFGGVVPVADVAMVTDLFVAQAARSSGAGSRLLAELLHGRPRRMTFSSQHPAALAAYWRAGMQARGRMLYLSGSALGGGPQLRPGAWVHGRGELIDYYAARGATVTTNSIFDVADGGAVVLRLDAADAIGECESLLRALAVGTEVTLYVSEAHGLAQWLIDHNFAVVDHDVLCTSAGVELPVTLAVLHPGLA